MFTKIFSLIRNIKKYINNYLSKVLFNHKTTIAILMTSISICLYSLCNMYIKCVPSGKKLITKVRGTGSRVGSGCLLKRSRLLNYRYKPLYLFASTFLFSYILFKFFAAPYYRNRLKKLIALGIVKEDISLLTFFFNHSKNHNNFSININITKEIDDEAVYKKNIKAINQALGLPSDYIQDTFKTGITDIDEVNGKYFFYNRYLEQKNYVITKLDKNGIVLGKSKNGIEYINFNENYPAIRFIAPTQRGKSFLVAQIIRQQIDIADKNTKIIYWSTKLDDNLIDIKDNKNFEAYISKELQGDKTINQNFINRVKDIYKETMEEVEDLVESKIKGSISSHSKNRYIVVIDECDDFFLSKEHIELGKSLISKIASTNLFLILSGQSHIKDYNIKQDNILLNIGNHIGLNVKTSPFPVEEFGKLLPRGQFFLSRHPGTSIILNSVEYNPKRTK